MDSDDGAQRSSTKRYRVHTGCRQDPSSALRGFDLALVQSLGNRRDHGKGLTYVQSEDWKRKGKGGAGKHLKR